MRRSRDALITGLDADVLEFDLPGKKEARVFLNLGVGADVHEPAGVFVFRCGAVVDGEVFDSDIGGPVRWDTCSQSRACQYSSTGGEVVSVWLERAAAEAYPAVPSGAIVAAEADEGVAVSEGVLDERGRRRR